jgi:hypothetical protein
MIYVGDIIGKFTISIGMKPCPECEKRHKKMNEMQDKIMRKINGKMAKRRIKP